MTKPGWVQALAGIYVLSNGSPIKDFGDDGLPHNNEKLQDKRV